MSSTAVVPPEALMRRSDLQACARRTGFAVPTAKTGRTSQIIFGERQYLLRALDSIESTELAPDQKRQEQQLLERLIHARTEELNRLNPDWDKRIGTVLRPDVSAETLDRIAADAPKEDYFLLRLISEHPRTGPATLARLADHPYAAVRENVARHPNADAATLAGFARTDSLPLWYLVASNPGAPAPLRQRLLRQIRQASRQRKAR